MLGRLRSLNQRGDTIIEVMIVLTVLSLALSIAYATANASLLNTRQAQENAEATGLAQAQVEALRVVTCGNGASGCSAPTAVKSSTPYCMNTDTYQVAPNASSNPICNPTGPFGTPWNISISYDDNPGDNLDTFTVSVKWDDVRGGEVNEVTLSYRVPI